MSACAVLFLITTPTAIGPHFQTPDINQPVKYTCHEISNENPVCVAVDDVFCLNIIL